MGYMPIELSLGNMSSTRPVVRQCKSFTHLQTEHLLANIITKYLIYGISQIIQIIRKIDECIILTISVNQVCFFAISIILNLHQNSIFLGQSAILMGPKKIISHLGRKMEKSPLFL